MFCNNCGKHYDNLDDFGYCKKCARKVLKQSKHTTQEQSALKSKRNRIIILVIIILLICIMFYFRHDILRIAYLSLTSDPENSIVADVIPIEDQMLTSTNYENLINEYTEKNKSSDNYSYLRYSLSYYIINDGLSSAFDLSLTEEEQAEAAYSNIYGKTINQLIDEGKKLMKENNMTPEKFNQNLEELFNS